MNWRKDEVFGVPADDAKRIYQFSQEEIAILQRAHLGWFQYASLTEPRQGFQGIRGPKSSICMAVHELEVLDRVFNIDQAARTVLDIRVTWFHQFLDLAFAKVEGSSEIPWLVTVYKCVTVGFHLPPTSLVAAHEPELNQI